MTASVEPTDAEATLKGPEPRLVLAYGWVCDDVTPRCTCGCGEPPWGHEPGCGLEPIMTAEEWMTFTPPAIEAAFDV